MSSTDTDMIGVFFFLTVIGYALFPMLFSHFRRKPIGKGMFYVICFGFNLIIHAVFFILGSTRTVPYVLWTWAFSAWGLSVLKDKGLVKTSETSDGQPCYSNADTVIESNIAVQSDPSCLETILPECTIKNTDSISEKDLKETPLVVDQVTPSVNTNPFSTMDSASAIRFCRKCGNELKINSIFCSRCGTKVFTEGNK